MARNSCRAVSFSANFCVGDLSFDIQLFSRSLDIGLDAPAQYYWNDSSVLRSSQARQGVGSDVMADIVLHQCETIRLRGLFDDDHELTILLLAMCYPMVAADKSLHKIYRSAHLRDGFVDWDNISLPDDIQARIKSVVESRNREIVRAELDQLFRPSVLSRENAAKVEEECRRIIAEGIRQTRKHGFAAMIIFADVMQVWLQESRRRGGNDLMLNHISYLFKAAFYLCYANFWVSLVRWLKEHRGLDPISERLLRIWHMQNQPYLDTSGILVCDVFGGQVLALHPLSGFLMKDKSLLASIGKHLKSAGSKGSTPSQTIQDDDYWKMIDAILTAAHLYRRALDTQQQQRGRRDLHGVEGLAAAQTASEAQINTLIEQIAGILDLRCDGCGEVLEFVNFHPTDVQQSAVFDFRCRLCDKLSSRTLDFEETRAALSR